MGNAQLARQKKSRILSDMNRHADDDQPKGESKPMTGAKTVDRLESLLRLYGRGYQSPVVDRTMEKLISLEIESSQNELKRLAARVEAYERQYGMASDNFYQRFRAGELGDDLDFVEWSIFWDMYRNTKKRLEDLIR